MYYSRVTKTVDRQRRTQDERSSAMRERLLDATVSCLVDYGYTGTTVTRIAERAGVTRGAQVHHYRTKDDLVTAAVTHLASASAELGWAQIAKLADAEDPVGDLLDFLWEMHKGPTFVAAVELWVAARTDPELRKHVGGIEPELMSVFRQVADPGVPLEFTPADVVLVESVYTAMDAIRGLLISVWHLPPRQRNARWMRAKERLRPIFPPQATLVSSLRVAAAAS